MFDRKTSDKEKYYFYKAKGICVICGKDKAMITAVRCPKCSDKNNECAKKSFLKIKQNRYEEYKANKRKLDKERRAKRRAAGICVICGKHKASAGKKRCLDCLTRLRNEYRRLHPIPRSERTSYGLCFICGLPLKDGYKLCEKHYRMIVKNLKPGIMTERRKIHIEKYKSFFNLIFMRKKINEQQNKSIAENPYTI